MAVGVRNKAKNVKLTELCYNSFLPKYVDTAALSNVDDLLALLVEGSDGAPRIKKASIEMLKALKTRIDAEAGKESVKFELLLSKACGDDMDKAKKITS